MRAFLNRRKGESGRGYPTLKGAFGVGLVVQGKERRLMYVENKNGVISRR